MQIVLLVSLIVLQLLQRKGVHGPATRLLTAIHALPAALVPLTEPLPSFATNVRYSLMLCAATEHEQQRPIRHMLLVLSWGISLY